MKARIIILILLLLIIGGGFFGFTYVKSLDKAYDPSIKETSIVEIPMGSGTGDIADILVDNGIIKDNFKFKLFSKLNKYDGNYVAGTYALSPSMTAKEICEMLTGGDVLNVRFTIPEGYTIWDIIETLSSNNIANKDILQEIIVKGDFKEEFPFLKDVPQGAEALEGYLFPDTYILPYGSTEEDMVRAMLTRFQDLYEEELKNLMANTDMSLHEILTIASIIEKETMLLEDKPLVSSVIYNRLYDGMKLRMDTTVIYAMKENKVDLTYDDIEIESPYNTYLVDALPIGPICCPGLDSIRAALNPADTDYFYFVVSDKGDGSIKFSSDDEEFERDKEAYYASREENEEG